MASTDWNFNTSNSFAANSGEAQLHSGLSSPLTSGGTHCRVWRVTTGTGFLLANRVAPVNLTNNQYVSVRGYVRYTSSSGSGSGNGVRLNVRRGSTSTVGAGYALALEKTTSTTFSLTYRRGSTTGSSTLMTNFGTITPLSTSDSGWLRLRIDLLPLRSAGDIIRFYRSTDLVTDNWTLLGEEFIHTPEYAEYVSEFSSNFCGFTVGCGNTTDRTYIDELQIISGSL